MKNLCKLQSVCVCSDVCHLLAVYNNKIFVSSQTGASWNQGLRLNHFGILPKAPQSSWHVGGPQEVREGATWRQDTCILAASGSLGASACSPPLGCGPAPACTHRYHEQPVFKVVSELFYQPRFNLSQPEYPALKDSL